MPARKSLRLRPMRTGRKRIWFFGALVAVAGIAGYFVLRGIARNDTPPLRFETARVSRGPIVAKVTATGTLSAIVTVQVGSQVSGRIQQLFVDYNSEVKKGQLLAKLDPQLFQAALEQARANHLAARGNLAKAEAQALDASRKYERARVLAERKLIALAERDTAESEAAAARAQVDAARGAVEQTQAAYHQAEVNVGYTSILSPIDGIVITRSVDVGQTVAASLQAPTLFVLAEDLRKMQVNTSVAEADIGKLRAGMSASFTVDAYPGERFAGKIRQIRSSPQTVQNVVTYDAVVDVENPALKLKPGMTANVSFVYAKRDDVLRVPNAALRFRPDPALLALMQGKSLRGGTQVAHSERLRSTRGAPEAQEKTIWVLRGTRVEPLRARTGISDGTRTEAVSGPLREGDNVVTDAFRTDRPAANPFGGGPMGGGGGPPRRAF